MQKIAWVMSITVVVAVNARAASDVTAELSESFAEAQELTKQPATLTGRKEIEPVLAKLSVARYVKQLRENLAKEGDRYRLVYCSGGRVISCGPEATVAELRQAGYTLRVTDDAEYQLVRQDGTSFVGRQAIENVIAWIR